MPLNQLGIREEDVTQTKEIDVDDVADGGERVQGVVEDLAAVQEENLTMEDDTDDEDDEEDDTMAT